MYISQLRKHCVHTGCSWVPDNNSCSSELTAISRDRSHTECQSLESFELQSFGWGMVSLNLWSLASCLVSNLFPAPGISVEHKCRVGSSFSTCVHSPVCISGCQEPGVLVFDERRVYLMLPCSFSCVCSRISTSSLLPISVPCFLFFNVFLFLFAQVFLFLCGFFCILYRSFSIPCCWMDWRF